MISDSKLDDIFEEVATRVRSSVHQTRASIIRDSRSRLARNTTDVDAIHLIAAASLQDREPDQSLSVLKQASSAICGNATGHRLAGYAYFAQQELESAMSHFDQAVRIDPCKYDSWQMLGGIQERAGQHDRAITYYRRALVFDDKNHESALALCRLYTAKDGLHEAIGILRISIFRDRRNPKLNLALAKLLEKRASKLRRARKWRMVTKTLEEAIDCYEIAIAAAPSADAHLSFGLLLQRVGRHQESKEAFEKAVRLKPASPIANTCLANAHVESGQMEKALDLFRDSIRLDPSRAVTHFRFSRAQKFERGAEAERYIDLLKTLLAEERSTGERVYLHFAVAKVLDDLGEYDAAWTHYDRANRMKPGHQDRRGSLAQCPLEEKVDDSIRIYTKEFFKRREGSQDPSRMPTFIVGMPRSGTTLTEQILSSHPAVTGAGELKQIDRIRHQLIVEASRGGKHRRHERAVQTGSPAGVATSGTETDRLYPELMTWLDANRLAEHAERHLAFLDGLRTDGGGTPSIETRVIDKMPTNFLHLGLIATLLPGATIIHCRRSPMDVLVSAYCQNLNAPFCDLEALVSYHRQYRRLMAHWEEVLPLNIHHVDYESLVSEPESSIRRMIDHCQLPWHDDCLKFHANRRSVQTPSKWQVRQPMYASSVQKWKRFATPLDDIATRLDQELRADKEWARYCD